MKVSSEKRTAINQYKDFVSSGKVRFFKNTVWILSWVSAKVHISMT